jgi:tetratricopeptide (TPR) repeat protein
MVLGRGMQEADWSHLEHRDPTVEARRSSALVMSAVLVLFGTILGLQQGGGFLAFVTTLFSLVSVWIVSVLAHELGHVAAAFAVRLTPFLLLVGGGPSLLRAEVLGVAIDIGSLPGGGLTRFAAARPLKWMKWRLLATYAAGPLVSIALLKAGLLMAPRLWGAFAEDGVGAVTPAIALVWVNGWLVLTSALPFPAENDSSRPRNDLLQILGLPWRTADSMNRLTLAMGSVRLSRLLTLRRYQAAFVEARDCLASRPDDWVVRLFLAEMLIHARRYSESAAEYATLLEAPGFIAAKLPPLVVALVSNNYAWANVMLRDPQTLRLADVASAKALELATSNPSVLSTRGLVLVEMGEINEGSKLLKRSLKLHRQTAARATVLASLALASARQGRLDNARQLFKQASSADSGCELLARVQQELEVSP